MEKTGSDIAERAERIEALVGACREVLRSEGSDRIEAVFLYGSSLDDGFRPDSDVDLAVLDDGKDRLSWRDQARLMDALERATGKGVDLRMLRESSPSHQAHVLERGRLVWSRDSGVVEGYALDLRSAAKAERDRAESEWPRMLRRLAGR
ncbi:MAG: nucleotidyltransferase domain-containing protein [Acidobacteriota bacterium]